MGMSPRLLRPRASGVHPEAAAWKAAVVANGGSVGTSLPAVDKFCRAIDSAGIRDRFYRLNLFCGSGLTACLVPLYRGPSLSGTQYGDTTDTNYNFVTADYLETGAGAGLTGNGSTKYLLCGSVLNAVDRSNSHQSVYGSSLAATTTSDKVVIGAGGSSGAGLTLIQTRAGGTQATRYFSANSGTLWSEGTGVSQGFILGSAVSATDSRAYVNGIQSGSTQTGDRGTGSQTSTSMGVFCWNNNGTATALVAATISSYSVGLGMTASQVLSFHTAMQLFQASLSRNV